MEKINFTHIEQYDTSKVKVIPFSRSGMEWNGCDISFGNMNPEYPVEVFGVKYPCPEYVYILGFYGKNDTDCIRIQEEIKNFKGGAKALKGVYRKDPNYILHGRPDFNKSEWHYHLMLYAVWQKCLQNKKFADMLLAIPDDYVIVESQNGFHGWSLADWGCKNNIAHRLYMEEKKRIEEMYGSANGVVKMRDDAKIRIGQTEGVWIGMNHQGKILMACREALCNNCEPPIDYKALNDAEIYFYGKEVKF